jgi:hypothetical protein
MVGTNELGNLSFRVALFKKRLMMSIRREAVVVADRRPPGGLGLDDCKPFANQTRATGREKEG